MSGRDEFRQDHGERADVLGRNWRPSLLGRIECLASIAGSDQGKKGHSLCRFQQRQLSPLRAHGQRSNWRGALDALLVLARDQTEEARTASPMPEGLRPLLVSPLQARLLLGVSMATLYNLMNAGALESCRLGGSRKITLASIEKFVAEKVAKGRCPAATGR